MRRNADTCWYTVSKQSGAAVAAAGRRGSAGLAVGQSVAPAGAGPAVRYEQRVRDGDVGASEGLVARQPVAPAPAGPVHYSYARTFGGGGGVGEVASGLNLDNVHFY